MSLRSNFSDQFLSTELPALDMVIYDEYERYPDVVPALFNVYPGKGWGAQTSNFAPLKAAVEKSEGTAVTFDDPIQGFDKTYTFVTYALAVAFSEELIEDDRYDMVEQSYRGLGAGMFQTVQIQAMNIFNNGFSDTGPDGENLFDASHPLVGGGTYNNRPSSDIAMSVAGLREMEVDLRRQVNHRNISVLIQPKQLIVPPELEHATKELVKSVDRPDTPNRAMNTFYQNYEIIVSPFLTSVTAWFAAGDKRDHQLRFYDRVSPSSRSWVDDKTGDVNTRIRCRFDVGYSDWIGVWGTSG